MIYGADFSTLPEVEEGGGKYYENGTRVDLVECLARHGISSARLRLWLDPYSPEGEPYGGGTCSTERMLSLGKRAADAGMRLMLDFHYSDFWADPHRQCLPKAWQDLRSDEICSALREYTLRTLERFEKAGLSPESVQVGNEITNGMLWPEANLEEAGAEAGYDRLSRFLRAGCDAVREGSDAAVLLHLERSGSTPLWTRWLDEITGRGVEFDELAASYYPYWHGSLSAMEKNLSFCSEKYGKAIRVVESSYAYTGTHYDPAGEDTALEMNPADNLTADGSEMPFAFSPEGQIAYIRTLKETLGRIGSVKALYWWEPGWIPGGGCGWATRASLRYCGEEWKDTCNEWAAQCMFDYGGNALPILSEFASEG